MHRTTKFGILMAAELALCLAACVAMASPFDKLKKKVEEKTGTKVEQKADEALGNSTAKPAETAKSGEASEGAGEAAGETKGASGGKVSSVSTKFDFVPGDSVILVDDFTQDELGEFPAKWKLKSGTFEVAESNGERWLRCTSDDGHIRMKVPSALPEFWTLEFDAIGVDVGAYLTVTAVDEKENSVWETMYPHSGKNFSFRCGDIFSSTPVEGVPVTDRHHVMFMARGNGIKSYMDRERLANVPDISASGVPTEIDFRFWAPGMKVKVMIANVRFAEGCRPAKEMLAEGKLVTYGIHFESGSDVVQADSAPILRQVASYMESKPDVKLKITGHTDNVGKPAANLDLSKRRAAAVANVLSTQFGVAADRFQTDGLGDTKPLSGNAKPEGRAMNRRVEFSKFEG
ncbi:MAG TPA: OmpA family protein [Candidatus Eisenbacteria bacterium]|nr:OmpA family protein [Candidatus Eisenbacteria bacterium]